MRSGGDIGDVERMRRPEVVRGRGLVEGETSIRLFRLFNVPNCVRKG